MKTSLSAYLVGVVSGAFLQTSSTQAQVNVPTVNIINRVMQIQYSTNWGTVFTIEVDKRQYLVTARHLVDGIKPRDQVKVKNSAEWVVLPVTVIDTDTNADIAVLAPPQQLTSSFTALPSIEGAVIAQDVYFLGYPYGLFVPMQNFNAAFTKKGIISSIIHDTNGIDRIYLDGHNNPGFSGGPIVFKHAWDGEWHICGVISGYNWTASKVVNGGNTNAYVQENTGIVLGVGIDAAVKAIKAHPVGPLVTY